MFDHSVALTAVQTVVQSAVHSADLTAVWKADHSADPWVCHLVTLTVASKAVPSVDLLVDLWFDF